MLCTRPLLVFQSAYVRGVVDGRRCSRWHPTFQQCFDWDYLKSYAPGEQAAVNGIFPWFVIFISTSWIVLMIYRSSTCTTVLRTLLTLSLFIIQSLQSCEALLSAFHALIMMTGLF